MNQMTPSTRVVVFALATIGLFAQLPQSEPPSAPPGEESQSSASLKQTAEAKSHASTVDEVKFEEAIFEKMRQKVSWQLKGEKLEDVVKRVRSALGGTVVLDHDAFVLSPISASEPINQDLDSVTLEFALDVVLRAYGMDWTVVDNAVFISSRDVIEGHLCARVYDVDDIVSDSDFNASTVDSLIDVIVSNVATGTWVENGGGEAEIRALRVGGKNVLVVTQSRRAHQGIRKLLSELRKVGGGAAKSDRLAISTQELREMLRALPGNAQVELLPPKSEALVQATRRCNQFSIELFRQVVTGNERNGLLSGYGVRESLMLPLLGARNDTQIELARVLKLPEDISKAANEALSMRSYQFSATSAGTLFDVANGMWIHNGLNIKSEFAVLAERAMGATVRPTDFGKPDIVVSEVNDWVARKTRQRIREILQAGDITPETYFVVANAVYFLGRWQTEFDDRKTVDSDFTLVDGRNIKVKMMNGTVMARYAVVLGSGLQVAELPYRGGTKSMVILLPERGPNAIVDLKKQLDAKQLDAWIASAKRSDVRIALPKFSFRQQHDLENPLADMGAERAFRLGRADFSGIATMPLALQFVRQQAFVTVDESGTEATAATVIGGFGAMREKQPEIIANRPFLFLIRDLTTGCVLFIGQVADPRASE